MIIKKMKLTNIADLSIDKVHVAVKPQNYSRPIEETDTWYIFMKAGVRCMLPVH